MDFLETQSRARIGFSLLSSLVGVIAILAGFSLLNLPPASLIVFVALLARMAAPVTQLQQGAQQFANFLPAYERMIRLETQLRPQLKVTVFKREPLSGAIGFRGVSYRHPGSGRGVEGLDFVIAPGSVLGLVGASGAGKSTFADLLVGLLTPQSGEIVIGGAVLDDEQRHHWRTRTGYVPQETFLFCDSIRHNLAWGNAHADDAAMRAALTVAGAGAVLARLSEGLDTPIGDHGVLLSGGERQKLAIARALLRRAPLLVLDEATNAIDVAAEQELLQRLVSLPWRPTVVLIAHRPESLTLSNRIVTLAEGRIVEDRSRSQASFRRGDASRSGSWA
jgi:ATP-binding cassette subfamily C protein